MQFFAGGLALYAGPRAKTIPEEEMHKEITSIAASLLVLALFSSAPSKAADMDWDACTSGKGETAIRGCTSIIARLPTRAERAAR